MGWDLLLAAVWVAGPVTLLALGLAGRRRHDRADRRTVPSLPLKAHRTGCPARLNASRLTIFSSTDAALGVPQIGLSVRRRVICTIGSGTRTVAPDLRRWACTRRSRAPAERDEVRRE